MGHKEAVDKIAELVKQAEDALREAESIADKAGVGFSWDYEYGMGGWYESGEWNSSSNNC